MEKAMEGDLQTISQKKLAQEKRSAKATMHSDITQYSWDLPYKNVGIQENFLDGVKADYLPVNPNRSAEYSP
jgi:hypothetical protein